jgi:hypothetical protein
MRRGIRRGRLRDGVIDTQGVERSAEDIEGCAVGWVDFVP